MRKFLDNDSERIPSGNLALMLSRLQELEELRDSLVDGVAVQLEWWQTGSKLRARGYRSPWNACAASGGSVVHV